MSHDEPKPRQDAEILLETILDSSDDAIIGKDLSGAVRTWNRGAERMYGYSAAEMIGQSIFTIVPIHRRSELTRLIEMVVRGERVEPIDTVRLTKTGETVEVTLTLAQIRDASGRLIGVSATARNITAQRRAERALRSSEARARAIVETAVDGIILIDRTGQIEAFNHAAERLFGYSEREVLGRNVSMLMPEPHSREHDQYLERYAATGQARVIGIGREITGRRRDGTEFPGHLSVAELVVEGEVKYTGIVRDLTERVALESRLREEASLVRIGELAAVLAHEVKNPLAAISGAIQVLGERLPTAEDQEVVVEILKRVDGLNAMMGDLLLYARPPKPLLTAVDVGELLLALTAFLNHDPQWRDIAVDIQGEAGAVRADTELVRIAVQNLLLNAVQAMRGKGALQLRLHTSEGMAHIDVIDAGPGISAAASAKLFTPFFTTKARGTGLGLATVSRIADAHGGRVKIVSTGPDGTTVRLTLPLDAR